MTSTELAKVEFYRVMVNLTINLLEERTGRTLNTIDAILENRYERALEYGNLKELKEISYITGDMYDVVTRKGLRCS